MTSAAHPAGQNAGTATQDCILVTGGAGFIGSEFVRQWLREERAAVVVLDKLTYAGHLDSLAPVVDDPRFTFYRGDIQDTRLCSRVLRRHQPTAIVNFAAESHVDRSINRPAPFVMTNVVGIVQLLEATRHYWQRLRPPERERFRFLHISTDEVYGSLGPGGQFTETTPYAPNSPYAASKAAADHFVRAYTNTYGLPCLLTACSNNYGPYQFPEKLIPLMILHAAAGRPLPIYGDGMHIRDWIHVEDHCRALRRVLALGTPGEVYNIGANCERTNREIVECICALVDGLRPGLPHVPCASLMTFVEDRPGHDRRYAIDATKICEQLGWRPQRPFEEALESTVRWYLDNPNWVDRVTGQQRAGRALRRPPADRNAAAPGNSTRVP